AQGKVDEFHRRVRVIEPLPGPQGYQLERLEESLTIRRRQGCDQPIRVYSRQDVTKMIYELPSDCPGEMLLPCRRGRLGSADVDRGAAERYKVSVFIRRRTTS